MGGAPDRYGRLTNGAERRAWPEAGPVRFWFHAFRSDDCTARHSRRARRLAVRHFHAFRLREFVRRRSGLRSAPFFVKGALLPAAR